MSLLALALAVPACSSARATGDTAAEAAGGARAGWAAVECEYLSEGPLGPGWYVPVELVEAGSPGPVIVWRGAQGVADRYTLAVELHYADGLLLVDDATEAADPWCIAWIAE